MADKLFRDDETYSELGNEVDTKVRRFAEALLKEYPDVLTRDLGSVAAVAIDMACIDARLRRQLKTAQAKRMGGRVA